MVYISFTNENVAEMILERVVGLHDYIESYWTAYLKWEISWGGNSISIRLLQNKKKQSGMRRKEIKQERKKKDAGLPSPDSFSQRNRILMKISEND